MVKEEYLKLEDIDRSLISKDPRFQDLTDETFGDLKVLGPYKKEGSTLKWVVECSCGNIVKTSRTKLKQRGKRSCVACSERKLKEKQITPLDEKLTNLIKVREDLSIVQSFGETFKDEWEVVCNKCNTSYRKSYRDLLYGVKSCPCGKDSRKKLEEKMQVVTEYCDLYGFTFEGWDTQDRIKIKVFCPKHNTHAVAFFSNVVKGKICCKGCKKEHRIPYNLSSKEDFIAKAITVHGKDKFNYDLVDYVNSTTKVKIRCNSCQETNEQTPSGHLSGRGCKSCSKTGFQPTKPCWIYIMRLVGRGEVWYKVGITKDLKQRLYNVGVESWYEISYVDYKYLDKGIKALRIEKEILSQLKTKGTIDKRFHREGCTEIFKEEELSVVEELLEKLYLDEVTK